MLTSLTLAYPLAFTIAMTLPCTLTPVKCSSSLSAADRTCLWVLPAAKGAAFVHPGLPPGPATLRELTGRIPPPCSRATRCLTHALGAPCKLSHSCWTEEAPYALELLQTAWAQPAGEMQQLQALSYMWYGADSSSKGTLASTALSPASRAKPAVRCPETLPFYLHPPAGLCLSLAGRSEEHSAAHLPVTG